MSGHTPGPWLAGHFSDDTHSCDCRSIVSEFYFGGIADVCVDNGISRIEDGANDCPPLEEAKANARLIAAAPDLLKALQAVMAEWREGYGLKCADQCRDALVKAGAA